MKKRIVGVIPNREFVLPKGIPIEIESSMRIARIQEKAYFAIFDFHESARSMYTPQQHAITIDLSEPFFSTLDLQTLSRSVCFALNFFSEKGFVAEPIFYACDGVRKLNIKGPLPACGIQVPDSLGIRFELKAVATSADIQLVFLGCIRALEADKSIKVTVDRFIQALAKTDRESQAVDLAICLESLFPFETEISFRFALFGALFSARDLGKRREIFKLLKDFYTLRSKIVHGGQGLEKAMCKLDGKWDRVFEIARYVILYKFNFLASNSAASWVDHLDMVAMGQEMGGSSDAR